MRSRVTESAVKIGVVGVFIAVRDSFLNIRKIVHIGILPIFIARSILHRHSSDVKVEVGENQTDVLTLSPS